MLLLTEEIKVMWFQLRRVMPVRDGGDRWRGGPGGPATPPAAAPARPSAQPQRCRGSSAAKQ